MARALTQNRREAVVVGVFVILNTSDGSEELIRPAAIDIPVRRGLRLVVVEVAIQMNGMRTQILQFGAGSIPKFLSPGKIPLIQRLRGQNGPMVTALT